MKDIHDEDHRLAPGILEALRGVMLYAMFDTHGRTLDMNEKFLGALGYDTEDIGRICHEDLLFPDYARSDQYRAFWESLCQGTPDSSRASRFGPTGNRVWMEATYLPVRNAAGEVHLIVLVGTDISTAMIEELEVRGKMKAIDSTLAVVEFMPDGMILGANRNFCDLMGYDEMELVGEEHRLFAPDPILSDEGYADFWADRAAGKTWQGEATRVTRSGERVYLNASYNPIHDAHGSLEKVVKFASDVTGRKIALDSIGRSLRLVREGNLEAEIATAFEPELEELRVDFNGMVSELRKLVAAISAQAEGVNADAGILAGTAADLSRRAENQASTLRQTSDTMDGISTMITETASNADQGTALAEAAGEQAVNGRAIVDEVIKAMDSIEEVTREINKITGLIDAIALQSRLLGLNAAVEAARAGDAGKGFNVVAAEVRNLAQKTADAAKQIGTLVSTTNARVQTGAEMVRDSGTAIGQINDAVIVLKSRIGDIAKACTDQADAVADVTRDIGELESITQQNSMVADQSAATSAALRAKSGELMQRLGAFTASVSDGTPRAEAGSE